jgi:hypothetical protein
MCLETENIFGKNVQKPKSHLQQWHRAETLCLNALLTLKVGNYLISLMEKVMPRVSIMEWQLSLLLKH